MTQEPEVLDSEGNTIYSPAIPRRPNATVRVWRPSGLALAGIVLLAPVLMFFGAAIFIILMAVMLLATLLGFGRAKR